MRDWMGSTYRASRWRGQPPSPGHAQGRHIFPVLPPEPRCRSDLGAYPSDVPRARPGRFMAGVLFSSVVPAFRAGSLGCRHFSHPRAGVSPHVFSYAFRFSRIWPTIRHREQRRVHTTHDPGVRPLESSGRLPGTAWVRTGGHLSFLVKADSRRAGEMKAGAFRTTRGPCEVKRWSMTDTR